MIGFKRVSREGGQWGVWIKLGSGEIMRGEDLISLDMKYYYSVVLSEQLFQNFNFISNCNISYFLYFMVFPSTNIFYQILYSIRSLDLLFLTG